MNFDLKDYVKIYPTFTPKFAATAVEHLAEQQWRQHEFYDPLADRHLNRSGNQELSVTFAQGPWVDSVMTQLKLPLNSYTQDLKMPWFQTCAQYSYVRFNRYQQQTLMSPHCDHIRGIFDGQARGIPILSMIGLLNDDYQGGELILWDDYEVKLNVGDVVVFPSVFLYPHRVQPVTQGTRYSLVSWGF